MLSMILLAWYGGMRWILLASSNIDSKEWLANSFGTLLAFASIIYILYFVIFGRVNRLFVFITLAMWLCNLWCLIDMTRIFIHDFTPVNFGYEFLDISILTYYTLVLRYCALTVKNQSANYLTCCNLTQNML
jgi:hypothetical protein